MNDPASGGIGEEGLSVVDCEAERMTAKWASNLSTDTFGR